MSECQHDWVVPRFGAEDERECRKCRVTAEEVTRAETNCDSDGTATDDRLKALHEQTRAA